MSMLLEVATRCRLCANQPLELVLDMGEMPLANAYCYTPDHTCPKYPLALMVCPGCWTLQLRHDVDRDRLFQDYSYRTGVNGPMVDHFRKMAEELTERYEIKPDDLVVDIGSNDGTLLSFFNCRTLGVDPGGVSAKVETWQEPFTYETAQRIGEAKLVIATNVLAHVPKPWQLLQDAAACTDNIVVEVPALSGIIGGANFDIAYHEHLYYFSLQALAELAPFPLKLTRFEKLPVHGGSWRIAYERGEAADVRAEEYLYRDIAPYREYKRRCDERVAHIKEKLAKYERVCGYGAPAKATTLLNYGGIELPYVVDSTKEKQGRYIPGVHIPIRAEAELGDPQAVLILAWNYALDIIPKLPLGTVAIY